MNKALLGTLVLLAGCKSETAHPHAAPDVEAQAAAEAAPAPESAADPEHLSFCVGCMRKMMDCFEDEAFWDVYATTYFAARGKSVAADEKSFWIGMQKDAIVALARGDEFEENCRVMLAEHRPPTEDDMRAVRAAGDESCPSFAAALGTMIFQRGVFHLPKDGSPPPVPLQ